MLIAQISDLHMVAEGALYQGVSDTAGRMDQALARLEALQPDLVLVTGDLAEHGSAAEYARVAAALERITAPLMILPGNHDDRDRFRRALAAFGPFPAAGPLHQCRDIGPLRLIALDVTVPGEHHGAFDTAAQGWLEAALQAAPDRPTILALHQPPYDTGMGFIDAYRCFGAGRLAALLDRHPQVRLVTCGHVHRFTQTTLGRTIACTAPALSSALDLRLAAGAPPASLLEPPALLLHRWTGRGLTTHLVPLGDWPGPFDFF